MDLGETGYISNGGWAFLLTTLHRLRDQGGDLVLAGMNPEVHDAFILLEYHKVIRLLPRTAEDAPETRLSQPPPRAMLLHNT